MPELENKKWYVLQVLSSGEEKVAKNLEMLRESFEKNEETRNIITSIRCPIEETYEIKNGKRKKIRTKSFPGYVLIEIAFPKDLVYARKIYSDIVMVSGVGTFIGGRKNDLPEPLPQKEIDEILMRMGEIKKSIHAKTTTTIPFEIGQKVKVIEGPFKDLSGKVEHIDPEKGKVRVKIEIFGMPTPVDLDVMQVEKI